MGVPPRAVEFLFTLPMALRCGPEAMRRRNLAERREPGRALVGLFARVALAGALALGCGSEQRPNVLLISIDTLRADHLEAYGYARETSPSLARLARDGARFENSYSQSSATVPTMDTRS